MLDFRDVIYGRVSAKYVLNLIRQLPYDSATVAEMRGGQQFRGWDDGKYLQVLTAQAVRDLAYITVLVNSDPKKKKPEPPKPVYVPKTVEQIRKEKRAKPGSFAYIAAQKLKATKAMKGKT